MESHDREARDLVPWQPITVDPSDAEYWNFVRDHAITPEKLCQMMGVPVSVLGLADSPTSCRMSEDALRQWKEKFRL